MSERYFIRIRGEVQGPFDDDRLQTLARRGRFSRSHEVSIDGGSTWSRATEFPELFPLPPAPKIRVSGAAEIHRNVSSSVDAHADDGHLVEPDGADSEIPWFYARDELQSGPFPFSEIKRLAEQGALYPDDLVWCNGMPEWIEAASVPGLLATSSSLRRRGQPWWIVSIVVAALLAGIAWLLRSFR